MTEYQTMPWRVGDEEPRAIYATIAGKTSIESVLIGVMDTTHIAAEAVDAHNTKLNKLASRGSYGEKEQMVADLQKTLDLWKKNDGNLEEAILEGFGRSEDARRVYEAVGFSASILGPTTPMPIVIQKAIDMIKTG